MPDYTEEEYAKYFSTLGRLDLDAEDGREIKITLFQCQSCGSVIAARAPHLAIHQALKPDEEIS